MCGRIRLTNRLEEHLLLCSHCRTRLEDTEVFIRAFREALLRQPINLVHETKNGPIYLRVTPLRNGRWLARHWGRRLDGGWEFATLEAANEWNLRCFAEMFPEHRCTKQCSPARGAVLQPWEIM